MAIYRTAQGKPLDMAALAAKNEKTRAVGNLKVNARGDVIDGQGRIVEPVTKKTNDLYAKTVGNRSAIPNQLMQKARATQNQTQKRIEETIEPDLQKLDSDFNDNDAIEIEQIKKQESQQIKRGKKNG